MNRRRHRALVLTLLSVLLAGLVGGGVDLVPTAGATAAAPADGYRATKAMTRTFTTVDGTRTAVGPTRDVTVVADHTTYLRGRERVEISWSGAKPSGGRASNPFGFNGLQQEYPVVILQCRGTDDASLPEEQQLSPETCFTSSVQQRSQIANSESDAPWVEDAAAVPEDTGRLSGITPFPSAEECPGADSAGQYTHLTAFRPASGDSPYLACSASRMPPEAAVDGAFPPNEIAAFTDSSGRGSVLFEVRSSVENESLGCSHEVDCSIVVIPIMGLSCDQPASAELTLTERACRRTGQFPEGTSNFENKGADLAVSPALWWSASNWENRFSVPITFGLPPDVCNVLDDRSPTGFYGSELLAQASLQWTPAYCLREDRFRFQHNAMSDEQGFTIMASGSGAAAFVSSRPDLSSPDPIGYAPTGLTGFGVGYVIDRPGNAGEFEQLRLNPRLLAKLLTMSYTGSALGQGHPGMTDNPQSINADPEFVELNRQLGTAGREAAATMLSLSVGSDVIKQLTGYIAADRGARDFLAGKPDPWGMRVNPSYEDIALPVSTWPLLDEYEPESQDPCRQANPAVYLHLVAAPLSTMRKIAEAVLDGWPNVQTRCELDQTTGQYKVGRVDRQQYGNRFMLGIVSLGDAARFGLDVAALRTDEGTYVGPTAGSVRAAVALAKQDGDLGPFTVEQGDLAGSRTAYPGTMVVHTAARLQNLDQSDADKVAQFIRTSLGEGQRPGAGNGELPEGFVPIVDSGVTRPLYREGMAVADAVEAQEVPTPGGTGGTGVPGGNGGESLGVPGGDSPVPGAGNGPRGQGDDDVVDDGTTLTASPTAAVHAPLARGLLPLLLLVGVLAAAGAAVSRFGPRGRSPL